MDGQKPERPLVPPRRRNNAEEIASNSSGGASDSNDLSLVRAFNDLCAHTYQLTTRAQALDAEGSKEAAFREYQKALIKIDEALNTQADMVSTPEIEDTTYKLRITRKSILERVADLQNSTENSAYLRGPTVEPSGLPSYAEACPYTNLSSALDEIAQEQASLPNPLPLNGTEVFTIANSQVQIYFISESFVSAPSSPSFLRVVSIQGMFP